MNAAASTPTTVDVIGKVYWNKTHRIFFAKYKWNDQWKTKSIPITCDTQDKAEVWFSHWKEDLVRNGVAPINDEVRLEERHTLRSIGKRWLEWKREQPGMDEREMRGHKGLLKKWIHPHPIADVDLERDLTLGHCTDWIEWVKKSGRAPYTIRNIVQGLRGLLVEARGKGWINLRENPMLDPYIRRIIGGADTVAGKNTIIHLKKADALKLLGCDSEEIPMMRRVRNLLAIATGCRLGEIAGWKWEDVRLDDAVPTIRVFRQLRKMGPPNEATFKDPKRKSHRVIPLHPQAVKALRWWRQIGWQEWTGTIPTDDSPLFPNCFGEYSHLRSADLLRSDLETAGLPTVFDGKHPFTFHSLRRTFMSLLEEEGVDREIIGALAGHCSKSVTDRHYIAKNIGRFAEVVRKLPLGKGVTLPSRNRHSRMTRERLSATG